MPRYQSIERCKGHWRKSCVTKREDLTTLVYIVATHKREGELRSNFFCFPLFRATLLAIRDAISFVSPLTTLNLCKEQLRMQRGQKVTISLDLSAGSIGRNHQIAHFKFISLLQKKMKKESKMLSKL